VEKVWKNMRISKLNKRKNRTIYDPVHKCCICKKGYRGYGSNALPISKGRCCDDCNINVVLPERARQSKV